MQLPGKVLIGFIEEGNVYLLQNPNFNCTDKPHFHVVVNQNPKNEDLVILVHATSQVNKQLEWANKRHLPKDTMVVTNEKECGFLSKETVFNCNNKDLLTKDELIELTDKNQLKFVDKVSSDFLKKLRTGLLSSPAIEQDIKNMLK